MIKIKNGLFQFTIVLLFFHLLSVNCIFADISTNNSSENKLFVNEKSYFSINLPSNWNTSLITDSKSTLRLVSKSPDSHQSLFIYVLESNDEIDLKKFADSDTKLFSNLGLLSETKNINDYFIIPKSIVKSYKSNNLNTKLSFQVKNNLGYILMWTSIDNDDTTYLKALSTFDINIPFSKTLSGWFSGILGWIVGIVFLLLSCGVLYLIGKIGTIIRKGIEIKKAIKIAIIQHPNEGFEFNMHISKFKRKSTNMIIIPLLALIIVFVSVYVIFSTKIFLYSLFGLIPIILGFFGIFFAPDLDELI